MRSSGQYGLSHGRRWRKKSRSATAPNQRGANEAGKLATGSLVHDHVDGSYIRLWAGVGVEQMKIDSWKCDICNVQRREANHWFRAYKLISGGVVIIHWDEKPTGDDVENFEAHLCGADCVTQWLSKNLL